MKKFYLVLLTILFAGQGQAQAQFKLHSFSDSLNNNILLFENVKDSLVSIRSVRGGVEWTVMDKDLNIGQAKRIRTLLPPNVLRQQLIAFHNKVLYVKQRILNNRFDIMIRQLDQPDDSSFTNGTIIHSEALSSDINAANFRVLNYYMNTSVNKKYLLLGRTIRNNIISDSVTISLIVLDSSLTVIGRKELMQTIKISTEGLISINVDNNGQVMILSGERPDTYMLGTELRLVKYDPHSGVVRYARTKVPDKKLSSFLVDNSNKDQLNLHVSFHNSNLITDIEGFVTVSINKNDLNSTLKYHYFSRDDQKELGKILGSSKKTVMNGLTWQTMNESNDLLTASVRYFPTNYVYRNSSNSYLTDRYYYDRNFLNTRSNFDPYINDMFRMRSNFSNGSNPSLMRGQTDGRLPYRETFMMFTKNKEELSLYTLHNRSVTAGLTYPKMLFSQRGRSKLLYNHKHQLVISDVTVEKELSAGKIVTGTKDMVIDEGVQPVYIGDRIYILTVEPKTRRNSILMLQ